MPLQNRVLPDQSIVAVAARGTFTGNRGILHDDARNLRRNWTSKAWICCALEWKATCRIPMTPHTWTELFFLDEAVALAAGHRPCATCRRTAYNAFRAAWAKASLPGTKAAEIDACLHKTRLVARDTAPTQSVPTGLTPTLTPRNLTTASLLTTPTTPPNVASSSRQTTSFAPLNQTASRHHQRLYQANAETLPDATFILMPTPHLIHGDHAFPHTPEGYLTPVPRPRGPVQVMTPAPLVATLRAGYSPDLHPTLGLSLL